VSTPAGEAARERTSAAMAQKIKSAPAIPMLPPACDIVGYNNVIPHIYVFKIVHVPFSQTITIFWSFFLNF
jgi:hypothetical protein